MSGAARWSEPPARAALGAGEVHVWRAALDAPPRVVEALAGTLGADEQSRARRFRSAVDRRRFTVARGLLRTIVGAYLDLAPPMVRFAYGAHGKPRLASPLGGDRPWPDLAFNVSHAGGLVLVAIAEGRQVGVDLEPIPAAVAIDALARRCLSCHEVAMLASLDDARRTPAFYRAWTRKEAYLKARGVGLAVPLGAFDVSLLPGEAARLLTSREDPGEVSRWTLVHLPLEPDYAAALAVEGRRATVRLWQWRENARPAR